MGKCLLYLIAITNFLLFVSWKTPDYRKTCTYVYQNLDARAKAGLPALLGKKSLNEVAANMSRAAKDSIAFYVKPLKSIHLGGPYKHEQLDHVLRPAHLQILNGIKRFERQLSNHKLPQKDRLFALQVLIGLHTAMSLPLQVTGLPAKSEILTHDIFMDTEMPDLKTVSIVTVRLYDAYQLGVRVVQAGTDQRMIASFMESGYKAAGNGLAGSLKEAFKPIGIYELGEGPNWGKIIEPGKHPIYIFEYPSFPGGLQYFNKFMNEHLHYPSAAWNKGIQGVSSVQIVVEKDGSLSHIKVVGPVSPDIDSEVVRAIRLSPKWIPSRLTVDGPPIRSQWTCITYFRIKPGKKREDAFNIPFHDNIKPAFAGGKAAFEKYIQANISHTGPPYGRVTVHYVVDTLGNVKVKEVIRSLSKQADAQAIKLMEQSPRWKPGFMWGTLKTMMGDTLSIWFRKK